MSATNGKPLDHLRAWAVRLQQKRGHNKATIALANKLARIAWAVWVRDAAFREVPTTWRLKSDPSDASLARSLARSLAPPAGDCSENREEMTTRS